MQRLILDAEQAPIKGCQKSLCSVFEVRIRVRSAAATRNDPNYPPQLLYQVQDQDHTGPCILPVVRLQE